MRFMKLRFKPEMEPSLTEIPSKSDHASEEDVVQSPHSCVKKGK